MTSDLIAFGPVPSRRLGRSLGVNNIPPKVCTYACVYCQLGRTNRMCRRRGMLLDPDLVVAAVSDRVGRLHAQGETIDFITFVPDGEPTLDQNLADEIRRLRPLGHRIAVITNSTLLDDEEVRQALLLADWVSLKVDAVTDSTWRRIDRPHRSLRLGVILNAMASFAEAFDGTLVTETMLVSGLNDGPQDLEELAGFLEVIDPAAAYLAVPTRPPAEPWVRMPDEAAVHRAYQIVRRRVKAVELLMGYEGDAFSATGNSEGDLLSITAVHPMRSDAVECILLRNGDGWPVVERLVRQEMLVELDYQGYRYFLRRLPGSRHASAAVRPG